MQTLTFTGMTTPGKHGLGNNSNKEVLQSLSLNTSLVSFPGYLCIWGRGGLTPLKKLQLVYSKPSWKILISISFISIILRNWGIKNWR